MNLFKISKDERQSIVVPGDKDATLEFCVNHFISSAKTAQKDHDHFFVALAGGSTPKAIYEALSKPPHSELINWSQITLFWGDERSVPPESEESNYHMAMTAGLKTLPIPSHNVIRMVAENDIQANAEQYESIIKERLKGRPFDLIMLGMGDDGHTASLFPNTKALDETARLVVANEVPQKKTWRMTMTYPLINQADNIAIYVIGDSKKEMVTKVLSDGGDAYPSGRVGSKDHKATWILDEAAAQSLIKSQT